MMMNALCIGNSRFVLWFSLNHSHQLLASCSYYVYMYVIVEFCWLDRQGMGCGCHEKLDSTVNHCSYDDAGVWILRGQVGSLRGLGCESLGVRCNPFVVIVPRPLSRPSAVLRYRAVCKGRRHTYFLAVKVLFHTIFYVKRSGTPQLSSGRRTYFSCKSDFYL